MAALETLAERAVAGDRAALGTLCRELQGLVYRMALRMLGHPADAEDAAQEILVLAVTHLGQFDGRSQIRTWVYRIAARHLMRRARSRAEERQHEVPALAAQIDAGLGATEPGAEPAGDARLLAAEVQLACTHGMLLCLSREERLAYIIGAVLGGEDRIGAEICEISRPAFRQRLARARAKLRPILEERCGLTTAGAPCACTRQAAAKQRLGVPRQRLEGLPREPDPRLARANAELGTLVAAGRVFSEPVAAPPASLWQKIRDACPELVG